MGKYMHLCDYWDELTENKIRQDEPSFAVFCFQSRKLKIKKPYENGKTKRNEKEIHLLEQKGYERMVNEIVPVQQAETYRKPTQKAVKDAVKELNPDTNSLGSRG